MKFIFKKNNKIKKQNTNENTRFFFPIAYWNATRTIKLYQTLSKHYYFSIKKINEKKVMKKITVSKLDKMNRVDILFLYRMKNFAAQVFKGSQLNTDFLSILFFSYITYESFESMKLNLFNNKNKNQQRVSARKIGRICRRAEICKL